MNAMDQAAHVRLELSSRAENVPVVRQALSGLASATGLSAAHLNDIGTAVTEACNNASEHAYGNGEGPLEVELLARDASMVVTVRDRGVGLALDGGAPVEFPSDVDGELAWIGVPSIKALARTASWREPAGGGTEVEMTFSTGSLAWEGVGSGHGFSGPTATEPGSLEGAIEVGMAPVSIARSVLPRLLRVMAVRAHFSFERHADVQRVGSVLLSADGRWASSGVQARLMAGSDSLELAIGPMSQEDVSRLAVAARTVEPELRTSAEHLDGGLQRLVLHLQRSPLEQRAATPPIR
jgi:anti-sigma regulatory factor (Ser/Thr protein kinase)